MVQQNFKDTIFNTSYWILRLIYVNLLWIVFSALGLIIGGLFPSIVAMFTVVRKWILGESTIPIFGTFWNAYKKQFLASNILGYSLSIIGIILYIDLFYLQHTKGYFLQLLYIPLLVIVFLFVLTLLYVFPIFVHYDLKGIHIVKNALLISIINPLSSLKMCLGILIIGYLMITFSGSIILFGGSIFSYFIMKVANSSFLNYEQKRKSIIQEH